MEKGKKKEESKKEEKDLTIEKANQKILKVLTKILYIIAKIAQICLIVGVVGLIIAMICIPIISTNIKIDKSEDINTLKLFGHEVEYTRNDEEITMFEKGKEDNKEIIEDIEEVKILNRIFDFLENKDLTKLTIASEFSLILLIALCVVEYFIFDKVYHFFKNIHDKHSPFIQENVDLLKGIAKLLICSIVITMFVNSILLVLFESTVRTNYLNVIEIIGVFCLIYIFEYGVNIQNETKGEIYSKGE